jgi:hypothetical protein
MSVLPGVRRLLVGAPFVPDLFLAAKHLCFAAMALFLAARCDGRVLAGGIRLVETERLARRR